ncbi:MAG: class I SAM-dependent methyltransferase [Acidobacteriia bacterium]|nr:class I SAM-dependent methyltransferase [Terriglobia bacterium]
MTDLRGLQQTWETLAQSDPLWAICTDPRRKSGGWEVEEFFATGEQEVRTVLEHVAGLGLTVRSEGRALDFGCGVGRLTRALAGRFGECVGVDIAATMVALAERHNRCRNRCSYVVNDCANLSRFPDRSFAFVYSSIVLQHMSPEYMKGYLREFARVLEPGGILVCQIPDYVMTPREKMGRLRQRLGLRTQAKKLLGIHAAETPPPAAEPTGEMEMNWLPEAAVRLALGAGGCRVVDVRLTNSIAPDFNGRLVYLTGRARPGLVSKQYCAIK